MEFQAKVITGPDEGKVVRVGEEQVLIGRSESSGMRLTDETVSWEHAVLQVADGKLFIENMSALGTRVRGQKLTVRTRLGYDEEVEISARTRVRIEAVGAGKKAGLSPVVGVAIILVLLLGVGVGVVAVVKNGGPPAVGANEENWAVAGRLLDQRMEAWVKAGRVPPDLLGAFREAQRLERSGDAKAASARWTALSGAMLTLPAPDAINGHPTFAENYSNEPAALSVLMGLPGPSVSEEKWRTDRVFADALVRFIYRRAALTKTTKESKS